MRLLRNDGEGHFSLVEYTSQDIPPYAILSHTWGPNHQEVTFQGITNKMGRDKAGYQKIQFCGGRAAKDGLQYFWVDTCCIRNAALITRSYESEGYCRQKRRALNPKLVRPYDKTAYSTHVSHFEALYLQIRPGPKKDQDLELCLFLNLADGAADTAR
jgi:hypothetical protein